MTGTGNCHFAVLVLSASPAELSPVNRPRTGGGWTEGAMRRSRKEREAFHQQWLAGLRGFPSQRRDDIVQTLAGRHALSNVEDYIVRHIYRSSDRVFLDVELARASAWGRENIRSGLRSLARRGFVYWSPRGFTAWRFINQRIESI
jgi:hypothetical protein